MKSYRNEWAIGDIHGRKDLLDNVLDQLNKEGLDLAVDLLVFLGDYVDRGPDSKGVLDTIRQLCTRFPDNVVALAGNHEDLMVNACVKSSYDDFYLWTVNGGDKTLMSFVPTQKVPDDYLKWVGTLPVQFETEKAFYSHAPLPKDKYRSRKQADFLGQEYTRNELTWGRPDYRSKGREDEFSKHFGNKVGVCGHCHALFRGVMAPRLYDHYIYADAGCGCHPKAPLVAIEVNSRKILWAWPKEALEGTVNET